MNDSRKEIMNNSTSVQILTFQADIIFMYQA